MFEIYLLRGDCSVAARELMKRDPTRLDEASVEDCARLDDALAKTYRTLQSTIREIQAARALRRLRRI
jgi:hypothetical protein